MPEFSLSTFEAELLQHLPSPISGKFCVAFSGGLDSAVLLHALAHLRNQHADWQVRAIHVDHQLQPQSSEWSAQCTRVAAELDIPMSVERVDVDSNSKEGMESAARTARYSALQRTLSPNEVLLTAHHADDQAETLLLALMRGSGVQGLASMPSCKSLADGWHVRPFLPFTRAELAAWADARGIEFIDDPSNARRHFDRNFMRHEVLQVVGSRWPSASVSISRSAGHLAEALELLEGIAVEDLRACMIEQCLRIDGLRQLSAPRRRNALRYWLRARQFALPSKRQLAGLEHDLFNTAPDRMPCVRWKDAELRWHRDLLYADRTREPLEEEGRERRWEWRSAFTLPAELGSLSISETRSDGLALDRLPTTLSVRFRVGHEKIRLPGRGHRHALRNLLQERDVLPWWRDRLPLIFSGTQLLAVGDLCWSDEIGARPGERAGRIAWEGAPNWKAVTRDP